MSSLDRFNFVTEWTIENNHSVGIGAEEGEYTITVFWPDMTKPEDSNGQRPDALNGAYDKVDKSQIFATVKAGVNELPTIKVVPGPANGSSDNEIYGFHPGGANVLLGDGSVRFLSESVTLAMVSAFVSSQGGEILPESVQ